MAAGAPPQTPLDELTAFYTLLERMKMRVKMNLPPISISWLCHCGEFELYQKLPFWSKMPQNRWRLGLPPQIPLDDLTAFYTLLERIEMREKMNLPQISISWLRHCSSLNLNRTKSFFFDLKCPKIVGGWGSAPGPAGGAYSAHPDPLAGMGWGHEICEFIELLGLPGCAPELTRRK